MNAMPSLTPRLLLRETRHFIMMIILRNIQNIRTSLYLSLFFLIVLSSCDKNQLSQIDSKGSAPVLDQLRIGPDSIYIDDLTPVNGVYTVSTRVRARVADNEGLSTIAGVEVDVIRGNGLFAASGEILRDDGAAPDSVRGDGLFSGSVQFTLTRAQAGRYQIRVTATDGQGFTSNSPAAQLKLARRNSSPQLLGLTAPDEVTRPASGSLLFLMTVAAADSDGLADISEVYFRSLTSLDPTQKFFMYDDGGIERNGVSSGDVHEGDGVFSIIVQLPSTASGGERRFAFQASDTIGDTSATLIHSLIVR